MENMKELFQLLGGASGSINPLARDIMLGEFEKYFSEQRFYGPVFRGFQRSSEPLTVELFCKMNPYTNPEGVKDTLEAAAEAGYFNKKGGADYLISKKGSDAIKTVHMTFYQRINDINQFPPEKMKSLAALLEKLGESVSQMELESGLVSFESSHGGHPLVEEGTLAQVDQLLDDLFAFRDDAHIAAWTPTGVSGQVWETLSFVWNREANTAEKLTEQLAVRNYSQEDYQSALDELVEQGWIKAGDEGYKASEEGKKVREDAEAETNKIYFSPWKALSDIELDQLAVLLAELKEINLSLVEENQTE